MIKIPDLTFRTVLARIGGRENDWRCVRAKGRTVGENFLASRMR